MKDEVKAEEYKHYSNNTELQTAYEWGYKDGFLAGLKAGRPQWHDLQKTPNDLPKEYDTVLVCTEDTDFHKLVLICNYHYGKWWIADGENLDDVIAWCEIPTFDKE